MKKSGNRVAFSYFLYPVPCDLYPFLFLLIAFFFASCAPKKPPTHPAKKIQISNFTKTNRTFYYSHHYLNENINWPQNYFITMREIYFNRQEPYYYNDFHFGGNKDIQAPNVWGKPFTFRSAGTDMTAAFNAWIGISFSLNELILISRGIIFERMAVFGSPSIGNFYWDDSYNRFLIIKNGKKYFDATNDALVSSYLLLEWYSQEGFKEGRIRSRMRTQLRKEVEITPHPLKKKRKDEISYDKYINSFKEKAGQGFDTLASLIDDNGHLSCCMIDGKVYNEMYSRHGLVIASLVYAYKVLGKELYAEKAKKLADYFIAHNYHKEGYFDNWISIGTDSEICTGLLEVYDITGDKKYLNICENVAKYYNNPHAKMTHNPQGHKDLRHDQHIYSTVDQAEFVILLKNLYAFTKNKHYLDMARGILKDLDRCYDTKWKLYSHMCYWNGKHDDHFFAVIQAIIYIAML